MNWLEIKNLKSWRSERVQLDILNIESKKQPEGGADRVSFFFLREIVRGQTMTKKIVRITPAEKRNAAHSEAEQAATPIPAVVPMERPKKKRVRNYKRHTAKLLSEEFPDIMQTLAKKSKEGSLSHTKYLFEIARVKEDIERQGQGSEPSLAELLLAEVRKRRAAGEPNVENAV